MYESEFDTDWNDLERDGALRRAFALGVARSLGDPNRAEYERVRAAAGTTYERSLVELSYEEGRQKAAGRRDEESTTVWTDLVVETDADDETPAPASRDRDREQGGPPSMTERPEPTVVPDDGLERVRFPECLRR